MSIRYRDGSGTETICSGLTPGGELAYGTSTTRTGTIPIPSTAGGADTSISVSFIDPLPDTNYETILQATAYFTIGRVSNKTINGFDITIRNTMDTSKSGYLDWYAFELYDIQHAQQNAESIATIEAMVPSGAGAGNKLTTKSYVDNADNALDSRVSDIEDVVPIAASITNKLVTSSDVARDTTVTESSTNLITSGGVYNAIADKDTTPTVNSTKAVTSGGIKTAIDKETKVRSLTGGHNILENTGYLYTTSEGIEYVKNSDGSVTIEGDTTGKSYNSYYTVYYTEDENEYLEKWGNKQIIVSGSGSNLITLHIEMNSVAILNEAASDTELTMPSTFNTRFGIYIRVLKSAGVVNQTFYPMIRYKEDTNAEWAPHTKTNRELTVDKAEEDIVFNFYGAKNLIPYPYYQNSNFGKGTTSYTFNGITYTDNGDGSITIDGTATGTMSYCNFLMSENNTSPLKLKNGKYILSGVPEGAPTGCKIYVDRVTSSSGSSVNYGYNYPGIEFSFTVNGDYYNNDYAGVGIGIIVVGGVTVDNVIIKPMLRPYGVQDSTWQPYIKTNNQLTIDKAEENAAFNVYGAKNLLTCHYNRTVTSGMTFTMNADDSVTISGTPTTDCYIEYIPNLEPRQYILSGLTNDCVNIDIRLYLYKNGSGITNIIFTTPGDHFVDLSNYDFDTTKFYINRTSNNVACSGTIYPMIRLAEVKDDTYVPGVLTNKELTEVVSNTNIITYSTMATVSSTNNPLSYAESMINSTPTIRIHYIGVKNNSGYTTGAPVGYTVYTLKQVSDAITVQAIEYSSGRIYTNGRSKAGSWSGWKISPAT